MKEFAFDLTLSATVRVNAKSKREAIKLINEYLGYAEANLGAWPNGDPIEATVCYHSDDVPELVEIDGEAV